jgi:hypothetical protein
MTVEQSLKLALMIVAGTLAISGTLVLVHPDDSALLAITMQLLLLLGMIGPLWFLRPRSAAAPLPTPPWGRLRRMTLSRPQVPLHARWMLLRLWCRAALIDMPAAPLAHPRPAPQRRSGMSPAPLPSRRHRRVPSRQRRFTIPLPTLDIEFVAPGRRPVRQVNEPAPQTALLHHTEAVVQATLDSPEPTVLALHDQPRQLTLQFATSALLTTTQQRAVIEGLRQRGVVATWSDVASLTVRRKALLAEASLMTPEGDRLWVPVLTQHQMTTWWPLPRQEHLLLAGHSAAPLAGLLARRMLTPSAAAVPLLIHDPDGRLRDHAEPIGGLAAQPNALDQARQLQLQYRFSHERATTQPDWTLPLCLIVAPTEQIWPEVQPLLTPDSGVQVVLILGGLPPIAPLRALCYRLPVIESAHSLTPPLPETFRPAGVPVPRPGQVVAWMRGGSVWWRGRVPELAEATEEA